MTPRGGRSGQRSACPGRGCCGGRSTSGRRRSNWKEDAKCKKNHIYYLRNGGYSRFAVPVDLVVNVPEGDGRALASAVDEGRGGLDADAVVVLLL